MNERREIECPLCGATVNVQLTITPKLIYTTGNGTKGFLTADVGVGGMEHTCLTPLGFSTENVR